MKTKLKFSLTKVFLSILFCGLSVTLAIAQSETTIEDRLAKLEAQLAQQNTTIANLQSEVQSVVKQNLALKKNLNLKPTIAKSNPAEGLEYRVLEVTGNKETNELTLVLTVSYDGLDSPKIYYAGLDIVDDLGNGLQERYLPRKPGNVKVTIDGVTEDAIGDLITHYPMSPYKMTMRIKKYNPDAQYIKYSSFASLTC